MVNIHYKHIDEIFSLDANVMTLILLENSFLESSIPGRHYCEGQSLQQSQPFLGG